MNADNDSLDLLGLFVNNFDVQTIYELGWYASAQWTAVISGILIALAIAIRSFEEKVALASGGQTNYQKFFVVSLLVAVAMGLYFTLSWLIINFFNNVYGLIDTSDGVKAMATQLDSIMSNLLSKDYEFSMSEIYDSIYAAFATIAYAITFCTLIFVILAMRIAHAALVSFCLFWGSAALPMSITLGLKQLAAFKTMCIIALTWPIIDAFLMYLIAGSFAVMIDSSGMGIDSINTWSLGTLVFYMGAFSIINCILVATTLSAPFIAQGLANGTGNVTGMIGSFGAAGVTTGMIAGKSIADKSNWLGAKAGEQATGLGKRAAGSAFSGLKEYFSSSSNNSNLASELSGSVNPNNTESNHSSNNNLGSDANPVAEFSASRSQSANRSIQSSSANNITSNNSSSDISADNPTSPFKNNTLATESLSTPNSFANSANVSNDQLINQHADSGLDTPNGEMEAELKRKKEAQAKRGAIINQQRNMPR